MAARGGTCKSGEKVIARALSSEAALPRHMAISLWLTVGLLNSFEAAPQILRHGLKESLKEPARKGKAFPQCAAAEPQSA
jgi:hypothetical protein